MNSINDLEAYAETLKQERDAARAALREIGALTDVRTDSHGCCWLLMRGFNNSTLERCVSAATAAALEAASATKGTNQ